MDIQQYVDRLLASCLSDWEGCLCDLPPAHDGFHRCACPTCDCVWTTEQAEAWRDYLIEYSKGSPNG